MATQYKFDICGPEGCGKSSFMLKHYTGDFLKKKSNLTHVTLIYRTNNNTSYELLLNENSHEGDAMIIMFDIRNFNETMIEQLFSQNNKPKVLCATCCDLTGFNNDGWIDYDTLFKIIRKNNSKFYMISSKTGCNIADPLTYLLEQLTGNKKLHFV